MTRLHATLVTPVTGPLALFCQASANGLRLWAEKAASLPSPWTGVDLTVRDSGEQMGEVMRAALKEQPNVVFGPYGSAPMLAAARSTSRVIWNHGGATSKLARPAFPHVINVLAPSSTYFASALRAIYASDPTIKIVSLLHSTSGFGRDVANGAVQTAQMLGLEVQAVPFEPSHVTEQVEAAPDADVLMVVGNFADERAVAPLLLERTWRYAAFVGAGVEEVLAPLGAQREGLIGPAQWIASAAPQPDEGPDVAWFTTHYRNFTGDEPPYPAAQAFAAGLLYARCLRDTGSCEDEAMLAAAQNLHCTTLYGAFQLDPQRGLQVGHQVLIVQWQHGQRRVVWPPEQAECSVMSRGDLPRNDL